ncbi:MAG: hypothetical protein JM58_02515 [Peptococcaceae bacterium BICA1-8]|nr:MAG: hypothetical protein JM58_02515 [Peptococcaceae bacterium BICA1-8]
MQKIELLAPAGKIEAFRAAVENGADAVYLGGSMFSARQNATNFTYEELKEAINFAHGRRVKVYVAVNTLVANEEIDKFITYLYQLAEVQVDAIIVQDLGIADIIRKSLPQMELHASTQMTIHNSPGVKFLEDMGFSRGVLAREVSFENIKLIKQNSSLGLETFVHGALCIAYSGQCLMSSMIGGRSGNRGRCAQPCRMKYELVDQKGDLLVKPETIGEHLLSPRDLKMIQHIPELIDAGIVSLKIEGRMKRPEYVATVVRNYREAIDRYYQNPGDFQIAKAWGKELEQIFNRDFTTGYYFGNQGKELMSFKRPNNRGLLLGRITKVENGLIFIHLVEPLAVGDGYEVWVTKGGRIAGELKEIYHNNKKILKADAGQEIEIKVTGKPRVGDRVFKTHDIDLIQRARESYLSPKVSRKIGLQLEVSFEEGKKMLVKVCDAEGYDLQLSGDFTIEKAKKHPLNYDTLWQQFARLGNTPFELNQLDAKIKGDLIVPVSELNQMKRNIVEGLINMRQVELTKKVPNKAVYLDKVKELQHNIPQSEKLKTKTRLSVLVGNLEGVKAAVYSGANQVYFNWEGLKNKPEFTWESIKEGIKLCEEYNINAVLRLPRLISETELNKLKEDLVKLKTFNFHGFLVGNLGILNLAVNLGLEKIYADYTLNIFNDYTIQKLLEMKISQATLSPELTLEQINNFSHLGNLPLELIVHGNFPLMVSEYCAIGSIIGNKTSGNSCQGACVGKDFGLKDRMNFIFPLEMDTNCRMLVYNAKPLNLYKDIKGILSSGVNIIRIEGRKENAEWVGLVTQTYRQAIDDWFEYRRDYQPMEQVVNSLEKLEPGGFTTGHYFRGVL